MAFTNRTTKPAHYRGGYHVASRKVRQAANADPLTRCWRCGNYAKPGDPWQAGHIIDSHPDSPLAAEHRSCNLSAGARLGNQRRQANQYDPRW